MACHRCGKINIVTHQVCALVSFSGSNRGQPLTAGKENADVNTPIKERLRPRVAKVEYGSDDGEDSEWEDIDEDAPPKKTHCCQDFCEEKQC